MRPHKLLEIWADICVLAVRESDMLGDRGAHTFMPNLEPLRE